MAKREIPVALSKFRFGTTEGWRRSGVSTRQQRTLIRDGELVRYAHGVYIPKRMVEWAGEDPRRKHVLRVYAALASVKHGAVPSHRSAAVMHGIKMLTDPKDEVTLTLPPGTGRAGRRSPGLVCYVAAVPKEHLESSFGVPVTNPARTVADLIRSDIPFWDAVVIADSAWNQDLAARSHVEVILRECKGWPGTDRAHRVLVAANRDAESPLETCGRLLVIERGLDPPEVQASIRGEHFNYAADLYWPRYRTIVEFDGMIKYKSAADHDRQYRRDQNLRGDDYKLVHVSWDDVFLRPDLVIERIRKAFAAPTAY